MIDNKRVLALIPARGGSKGLPGKNLRPLLGKPLIAWSIELGLSCKYTDAVVVSTDDPNIAREAARLGADVPFMRPTELASDTASTMDVLLHSLDELEKADRLFDIVVLLEPTSPLRDLSDVTGALEKLVNMRGIESVVGVARVESSHPSYLFRIASGLLSPYQGVQPTGLRRQELDELYFLEGSVYASYVASLRTQRSFYHAHTAPWIVSWYKSLEIDDLAGLIAVEALLAAQRDGRI
ncbi:MAG: acylneuraminate cytidylyltransferase family protein [Alphaproteobacteria bacterium]|nr:acylneuraminate cytidylyltransferase family protein [Alphaproteobacteria bacterium]